jgi:hypothetical protein
MSRKACSPLRRAVFIRCQVRLAPRSIPGSQNKHSMAGLIWTATPTIISTLILEGKSSESSIQAETGVFLLIYDDNPFSLTFHKLGWVDLIVIMEEIMLPALDFPLDITRDFQATVSQLDLYGRVCYLYAPSVVGSATRKRAHASGHRNESFAWIAAHYTTR